MSVPSSSTVMPRIVIFTVRTTLALTSLPVVFFFIGAHEKKKKKKKKKRFTKETKGSSEQTNTNK
jgi:hypothetical protein